MPGERVPLGWRVADAETLRIGQLESAPGKKIPSRGGIGASHPFQVKLGRRAVCLQQPSALALLLPGYPAALLVAQLDAGPGREPLDCLGEVEVVDLLDELDHVAALGAREAVPQPAGRGDVERRRLLIVKRAEPLERSAAGVAKLQVLPHNLVDGRALADQLDILVADPACHVRPPQLPRYRRGESSPRHRHCVPRRACSMAVAGSHALIGSSACARSPGSPMAAPSSPSPT